LDDKVAGIARQKYGFYFSFRAFTDFDHIAQLFAELALDLSCPLQELVQRAEFLDQLDGCFLADARHAGDVVGAVSGQAEDIGHQIRSDAETLDDLGDSGGLALHGVEERHPLGDDLHQVLVAGYHHHPASGGAVPGGQCPDDVVGLVAGKLQSRYVEGPHHVADRSHLDPQVIGHGGPVGLVFGIEAGAERDTSHVEHYRHVLRVMVLEQLEQHLDEAVDGIGRVAGRGGEVADGVVGPVDIG